MRRLTVALLTDELRGGDDDRTLIDLASALDAERFAVIVCTLRDGIPFADDLHQLRNTTLTSLESRGWGLMTAARLSGLLRREGVHVVQSFGQSTLGPGMLGGTLARTPVRIATERFEGATTGRLASLYERWLLGRATFVVASSEAGARRVIRKGIPRERVRVVNDGLPAETLLTNVEERQALRHDLGVLDESWLIGAAAELSLETDLGSFLQAASIVRAEVPGTKFMLLGDGPLRSELMRRATMLGLAGSLIITGRQARRARYVGAMDVAVIPSGEQAGSSRFLGEAMALGRPVVATDDGPAPDIFRSGEAGLVVPPVNPLILAHAILETMRHPDAVERMRERGRELFRERFTVQRMVRSYEDLYLDLWRRFEERDARREPAPKRAG